MALSVLFFAARYLKSAFSAKPDQYVRSESLVSPTADSDLAKLESDVILSALASTILPRPVEKGADRGLASDEAEDVIEDFKRYDDVASERWERIGWIVSIAGGIAFFGISVARAIVEKDWRVAIFPVSSRVLCQLPVGHLLILQAWIAVLSISPRGKVVPLLTIHLLPSFFLYRSAFITHSATGISIAALVVELAYFFALICLPYQDPLDRLLGGAHCKGGGNSGSDVPLPKHYEEPICELLLPWTWPR